MTRFCDIPWTLLCLMFCISCSASDNATNTNRSANNMSPGGVDMNNTTTSANVIDMEQAFDMGQSDDMAPVQMVAPKVLFDLEAAATQEAFYDFPMPSDLRLDDTGRPDVAAFPSPKNLPLIEQLKQYVADGITGFAPHSTSYVRFTTPLDTSTLAAALDPEDPAAPVWMVDVDRESPDFGKKFPLDVQFVTQQTRYWSSNMLSARVIPGTLVRPGNTYALLVRQGLREASGELVGRSSAFQALLDDASGEDRVSEHYADLFSRLDQLGIDKSTLLMASMYTTSNPRPQMDALTKAAKEAPLLPLGSWRLVSEEEDLFLLEGSFSTREFLSGETPFDQPGTGGIEFDTTGTPVEQRVAPVRLALSIPKTPAPAGGYPVVVYSHGTGGSAYSGVQTETSMGQNLAKYGIATLGFDGALHGTRTSKTFDYATRVLENVLVVREMIRQSVVDQIILLRHVQEGLVVPPELLGGATAQFRPDPWVAGHSQGGQQNGLLVGVDVPLRGAFFSAAPGALYVVLNDQVRDNQRLGCLLGVVVRIKCDNVNYQHPAMSLLYQQTHAVNEPLNFLARTLRERPDSWSPAPHVALTEGLSDITTPPDSLEPFAAVLGVPVVEPWLRQGSALSFLETQTLTAPTQDNFMLSSRGQSVTAGLFQFQDLNHFAIFRRQDARNTYLNFFVSGMLDGTPKLDTQPVPIRN